MNLKFISSNKYADLLIKENIIDILFGETMHPELLKRCGSILVFLANKNQINKEIIEKIWMSSIVSLFYVIVFNNIYQGKHESIIHLIWKVIIEACHVCL